MRLSLFALLLAGACSSPVITPVTERPVSKHEPLPQSPGSAVAVAPESPAAVPRPVNDKAALPANSGETQGSGLALFASFPAEEVVGFGFTADGYKLVLGQRKEAKIFDLMTQRVATTRKAAVQGVDAGRARFAEVIPEKQGVTIVVREISSGAVVISIPEPKADPADNRGVTFSEDGKRISMQGVSEDCAPGIWDVEKGKRIPFSTDFSTAAPVCDGSLTASGRFVYFLSRGSGAFQDIRSKKVGSPYGRALMSPRDTFVVRFPDRNWVVDEVTPTRLLSAKNGKEIYGIDNETDQAAFSSDEQWLATASPRGIEIRTTAEKFVNARAPLKGVQALALSPNGKRLAALAEGRISVFEREP